jgi:hypothetical protein
MIVSHKPDVNPDEYCYETKIKFSENFCTKLLNKILEDDSFLIRRKRYLDPKEHLKEIASTLNFEDGKLLARRIHQVYKYYPNQMPIEFKQYSMPEDLTEEFDSLIPQWLKDIVPGEPKAVVQISQGGDFLGVHKGHQRQSSLFMLLQGNDEETRWYKDTGEFKVIDFYRIPDLDKIEHVVTAKLEPFKWTMFNHKAWHSVHKFNSTGIRINIGIDFDSVPAEELVRIIKEHE